MLPDQVPYENMASIDLPLDDIIKQTRKQPAKVGKSPARGGATRGRGRGGVVSRGGARAATVPRAPLDLKITIKNDAVTRAPAGVQKAKALYTKKNVRPCSLCLVALPCAVCVVYRVVRPFSPRWNVLSSPA
jgi:hypothetical protein